MGHYWGEMGGCDTPRKPTLEEINERREQENLKEMYYNHISEIWIIGLDFGSSLKNREASRLKNEIIRLRYKLQKGFEVINKKFRYELHKFTDQEKEQMELRIKECEELLSKERKK